MGQNRNGSGCLGREIKTKFEYANEDWSALMVSPGGAKQFGYNSSRRSESARGDYGRVAQDCDDSVMPVLRSDKL